MGRNSGECRLDWWLNFRRNFLMPVNKTENKNLYESLLELIRVTSTVIPDDVQKEVMRHLRREKKNTTAKYAMDIIDKNIELAKTKSQPICQDTGTILIYVTHPANFDQLAFEKVFKKAVVDAT